MPNINKETVAVATRASCLIICVVEILRAAKCLVDFELDSDLTLPYLKVTIPAFVERYFPIAIPLTYVFLSDESRFTFKAIALVFTLSQRWKQSYTQTCLVKYWFLIFVPHVIPLDSSESSKKYLNQVSYPILSVYLIVALLQWILCTSKSASYDRKSREPGHILQEECPELHASLISKILFNWVNGFLDKSFKRPLNKDDVFKLNPRDMSRTVVPVFENNWNKDKRQRTKRDENDKEFSTSKTPKNSSLLKVLIKSFGMDLLPSQIFKIIFDISMFAQPIIMRYLIEYAENKSTDTSQDFWRGYRLVVLFFVLGVSRFISVHLMFFWSTLVGIKVKAALTSAVYKKALTISNQARKQSSIGEIVNLMSVDIEDVKRFIEASWTIWSTPLQIGIDLFFIYTVVGTSVFSGILVLAGLMPLNALFFNKLKSLDIQMTKEKDKRIKLLTEVLNGIKILKLYAWEMAFKDKILAIRERELSIRKYSTVIHVCLKFTIHLAPFLVAMAIFSTYIYISDAHHLDAQTAFVAAHWIHNLRFVIFCIPYLYIDTIKTSVALRRLGKFLNNEDIDKRNVSHDLKKGCAIQIEDGTFMWDTELGHCLEDISVSVAEGSLIAIVGPVGAGKSSMLSAMLGEMIKVKGDVNVQGSVAYVSQQPWIQHAKLKENILFGKEMQNKRYQSVIDACSLAPDLEILPAGDDTEIGEKGVNLSGGQKQRVSLARAVYHDTDIYYLDDPLSAVDSHVGKHIFENVISNSGLLSGKTRVLVTHGIHWLPFVDKIIVMNNGGISEMGTYDELLSHNGPFAKYLQTYLIEDHDSDSDETFEIEKKAILQRLSSITSEDGEEEDKSKRKHELENKRDGGLRRRISRSTSVKEEYSIEKVKILQSGKLVQDENIEIGNVKMSVYLTYARATGLGFFIASFLCFGMNQVSSFITNIWLRYWTDDNILTNVTVPKDSTEFIQQNNYYLSVYGSLVLLQASSALIYGILLVWRSTRASRILHEKLLHNVLRSPMSFFDTTPVGRIVHIFSKDISVLDGNLALVVEIFLDCFLAIVGSAVVITYASIWFLFMFVALGFVYWSIQRYIIRTKLQVKRLESSSRAPIYSHFNESIAGASVIRAFEAQDRFSQESQYLLDTHHRHTYSYSAVDRWQAVRLQFLGNFVAGASALLAVVDQNVVQGGLIGLCITYAIQMTERINAFVRMSLELETSALSIEKIKEYTESTTEADLHIPEKEPADNWPQKGVVQFQNYSTRYRKGLNLVLKDISAEIAPGEKVGIVGRTGAGKSSLTLALFRLIEPAGGSIIIDGEDISQLGLHDCRSKLTILPQDPVLFSGTLRMNLDPFNQYTEEVLWESLEHAHLKTFIESLPGKLDVGQRQLLCLARSLLQKTKVLVLDEATAAVDMETDDLIQQTIRTEFNECTVLTIAHRINTVMDYDRIMVLEQGRIKEFDRPDHLLQRPNSLFYQLAKNAKLV